MDQYKRAIDQLEVIIWDPLLSDRQSIFTCSLEGSLSSLQFDFFFYWYLFFFRLSTPEVWEELLEWSSLSIKCLIWSLMCRIRRAQSEFQNSIGHSLRQTGCLWTQMLRLFRNSPWKNYNSVSSPLWWGDIAKMVEKTRTTHDANIAFKQRM